MTNQIPYLDLITPAAAEPISLDDAKLALRVENAEEDSMILGLIKAARVMAEEYLHRSLVTQTWQLQYDKFAPSIVPLPRGPVQEIVQVKIIFADWSEQALPVTSYYLNAGKENLVFEVAPMGQIIQIQYKTGYGDSARIPEAIKQGILSHVVAMYENRGGARNLPESAVELYNQYKIIKF